MTSAGPSERARVGQEGGKGCGGEGGDDLLTLIGNEQIKGSAR